MDRDFLYRQTLVWLEHEFVRVLCGSGGDDSLTHSLHEHARQHLAESLTNHLINNWEMVQRAETARDIGLPRA